ncbi:MAG: ATP-binding protein, partial [Candidatus Babeliales bacterium]
GMNTWSMENGHNKNVDQPIANNTASTSTTSSKDPVDEKLQPSSSTESLFEFNEQGYTFTSLADQRSATQLINQLKANQSDKNLSHHFFIIGNNMQQNEACAKKISHVTGNAPLLVDCAVNQSDDLFVSTNPKSKSILILSNFHQASPSFQEKIVSLITQNNGEIIIFLSETNESFLSIISQNIHYSLKEIIHLTTKEPILTTIKQPLTLDQYSFSKNTFNTAFKLIQELRNKQPNDIIKPFLIVGPDGIGKKTLLKTIAHETNYNFLAYDSLAVLNNDSSTVSLEEDLLDTDPVTICCIEKIDQLYNKDNPTFSEFTNKALWKIISNVHAENPHIVFAMTGPQTKNIFPQTYLKLVGRITALTKPIKIQRTMLLKKFIKQIQWSIPEATILDLVQKTVSWSPRELEAIALGAQQLPLSLSRIERLQTTYTDIAKTLNKNSYILTAKNLDELHLNQEIKDEVNHIIDIVKNWKRSFTPRRSLLMYGPYGVAKTTIAEIIAREADAYFVKKQASTFVRTFVGSGAERIEEAFEDLKDIDSPVVFLIDELEGLAPSQDESSQGKGVDEYTKSAQVLWTLMDDFAKQYPHVFVIAACNNYEKIHPRIQQTFKICRELYLPTEQERTHIIVSEARTLGKTITNDLTTSIAHQTDGWSGRDLRDMLNIVQEFNEQAQFISQEMIQKAFEHINAGKKGHLKLEAISREKRIDKLTEAAWANWYVQMATLPQRIQEHVNMQKEVNYATSGRNIPIAGPICGYAGDWAHYIGSGITKKIKEKIAPSSTT